MLPAREQWLLEDLVGIGRASGGRGELERRWAGLNGWCSEDLT